MLDGRIFPYIKKFHPEKQEVDLPGDIFPVLFTEGVPIYGFVRDFAWWDIGRINDYEALVQMPPEQVGQILRWT
jgi:NDP-sugar pyrophosphorylase family protein